MKTDLALKALFRQHARELLCLTGDEGATIQGADVLELPAVRRTVDCVFRLEQGGQPYLRHLEFQAGPDRKMAERCFGYNSQLVLQYCMTVLTTVVYLFPPAPRGSDLVFRMRLGDREINRWSFEVVRLWEWDAEAALAQGSPGLLALVPLMKGGADLQRIERAVRTIEAATRGADVPVDVLLLLAGRYYTVSELTRIVGRERMIQSSVYKEAFAEGEAQGAARGEAQGEARGLHDGRIAAERELCAALLRKHHPALLSRVLPLIEACDDPARLKEWALAVSDREEDLLRVLGLE